MKIAVINYTGNVGKTTLAYNLLYQNMPQRPEVISIETINNGLDDTYGINLDNIDANHCYEIFERVMYQDSVIVDVGSSNVESFVRHLKQFNNAHTLFDYFIVPSTPGKKQGQDTSATINDLLKLGVPLSSLRLIMNKIRETTDISLRSEFHELITQLDVYGINIKVTLPDNTRGSIDVMLGKGKKPKILQSVAIPESEVFDRARSIIDSEGRTRSITELSLDETDYRLQIRQAQGEEQKAPLINIWLACALARTQEEYHRFAWKALGLDQSV